MNFRVKVNLSEFFKDVRKEAYIFVKKEWKTVACVQDHIRNLFKLRHKQIYLVVGKTFLPENENIEIIKPQDTIT